MPELAENAENEIVDDRGTTSKRKRRRILIFVVVSLINLGLLVLLLTQLLTPAPASRTDPLVGKTAPDFSLAVLRPYHGQNRLSLANFKGRPVVLNFWASWCAPCKEEAPLLERSWQQAQGKDVVFLGVDFQDSSTNGEHFLENYDITYPIVQDTTGSLVGTYNLIGLPETVFISRNGTVVSKVAQELSAQALASNLQLIE